MTPIATRSYLLMIITLIDLAYVKKYAPHCIMISSEFDCMEYGCYGWLWLHRN